MGENTKNNMNGKRVLFFLFVLAANVFFAVQPYAQLTRTARVDLNDTQRKIFVGAESYITADKNNDLSFQVVLNRHENNLRGARQNRKLISLNSNTGKTWIVFSVTNNTSERDWVLDFGQLLDGRSAVVTEVSAHSGTKDTLIGKISSDKKQNFGKIFNKRAIGLSLEPNHTEIIALHFTTDNSLSRTISPFLMSQEHYIQSLGFGAYFLKGALALFFASMIGVFIAISYTRQKVDYAFFAGYYGLNILLFILSGALFVSPYSLAGELLITIFALIIVSAAFITRSFFRISLDQPTENTVLVSLAFLTIISTVLSFIIFGNSVAGSAVLYSVSLLSLLTISALSFYKAKLGQHEGFYYGAGWLCAAFGLSISALSGLGVIGANAFFVNAYWFSLVPQGAFFILSAKKHIDMLQEEERYRRSRQNRNVHSRARLQHSKESADQARLLRVIEREREIMAELREREMQRAEEMRIAKEEAIDANRAKSAFLAVVSHEIRTPMTGLLGILRLLGETTLSAQQQEYLMSIQSSGETMMALLNDILDFEKIERGGMDIEKLDMDLIKLAQGVVKLMSGHAADKGLMLDVHIDGDFPSSVIGDPTRLRQILLNLVNNAIKFTQRGTVTIHLRAKALEKSKSDDSKNYEVYIAVEDTGIGISKEAQRNLFNPFEQADSTISRRFGGTGLGLAICRRLVEAMGGKIRIKSEEGEGSTFYFTIDMQAGSDERSSFAPDTDRYVVDLNPMKILVIEDNKMNQKVLDGFLKKGGHDLTFASTAEEGIAALENNAFDVIFTDINLKGVSGIDVAKAIRALDDQDKSKTPIIAVSGNVSAEDRKTYEEAGMNGFVAKPIIPEELYKALEHIQNARGENSERAHEATIEALPPEPQQEQTADAHSKTLDEKELSEDLPSQDAISSPEEEEEGDYSFALDMTMIQGLLDSLGAESFSELMNGYLEKADEIIEELVSLDGGDDISAICDRAHELKGMAANFGVKETSEIAAIIEDAAQADDKATSYEAIKKLPDANRRAKNAISKLMKA